MKTQIEKLIQYIHNYYNSIWIILKYHWYKNINNKNIKKKYF